jgi:hypothetical protein
VIGTVAAAIAATSATATIVIVVILASKPSVLVALGAEVA